MKEKFTNHFDKNESIAKEKDANKKSFSYYSNVLNKVFPTYEQLSKAEDDYAKAKKALDEKANVKKAKAKEIENAYKEYLDIAELANKKVVEAQEKYLKLRDEFVKEYGSFHMTYSNSDGQEKVSAVDSINAMLDLIKDFPFLF